MKLLLGLVAVAAFAEPRRVVLLEELLRVDALRSRSYEFPLPQQKAQLEVRWTAKQPPGGVRVLVLDRRANATLVDSGYQAAGMQRIKLDQAGDYVLTVENRQQRLGFALIDLRMELVFGEEKPKAEAVRGASAGRRYWAIAGSLAVFAMMVTYAGVRLGPAVWERWRS